MDTDKMEKLRVVGLLTTAVIVPLVLYFVSTPFLYEAFEGDIKPPQQTYAFGYSDNLEFYEANPSSPIIDANITLADPLFLDDESDSYRQATVGIGYEKQASIEYLLPDASYTINLTAISLLIRFRQEGSTVFNITWANTVTSTLSSPVTLAFGSHHEQVISLPTNLTGYFPALGDNFDPLTLEMYQIEVAVTTEDQFHAGTTETPVITLQGSTRSWAEVRSAARAWVSRVAFAWALGAFIVTLFSAIFLLLFFRSRKYRYVH